MEALRRYFDPSEPISGSPDVCLRELRRRVRSVVSGPLLFAGLSLYFNRDFSNFELTPTGIGLLVVATLALVVAFGLWRVRVAPLLEIASVGSGHEPDERAAELANRIFAVWLVVLGSSLVSLVAYFATGTIFGLILGLLALAIGLAVAWPRADWFFTQGSTFHRGIPNKR